MEEQLITFETAKLAKEKGYDIPDLFNYDLESKLTSTSESIQSYTRDKYYLPLKRKARGLGYLAPTQSLLQKWLREVHDLPVWVYAHYDDDSDSIIYRWVHLENHVKWTSKEYWLLHEEALEEGLREALKLIK